MNASPAMEPQEHQAVQPGDIRAKLSSLAEADAASDLAGGADDAAGYGDNKEVYLTRQPWHDDPADKWAFCRELEARWEEIRAEFDTLRAGLEAKKQEKDVFEEVGERPPLVGEDKHMLESASDKLKQAAASEARIHPWPEINLYDKGAPRYETQETSDGDPSSSSGGKKLVPLPRRRGPGQEPGSGGSSGSGGPEGDDDGEEREAGTGWDVFGIYAFGKKHYANSKLCPVTTSIVETIPGCSTAAFSILKPGARILPHVGFFGYAEMILRCHLGLHVPGDEDTVWLQVAGVRRGWGEGKVFVFDDTFEHSASNLTDRDRVVLLLDFQAGKFDKETLEAMAERQTAESQEGYLQNLVESYGYGVKTSEDA